MSLKPVSELRNIGKTVAGRLHELGITCETDLRALGSTKAYRLLARNNPAQRLPVCYYLYSLEGAIQDKHWDDFSEQEKTRLRLAAGLPK